MGTISYDLSRGLLTAGTGGIAKVGKQEVEQTRVLEEDGCISEEFYVQGADLGISLKGNDYC